MRACAIGLFLVVLAACPRPPPARPLPPLPHAAYAHYLEAKLAAHRDDWPAAADSLAAAVAAAPDQPMIAVELARAQHKAKRDLAARDTLAAARKRWPGHAQVWLASGDAFAHAASLPEAIGAYRRAIELDPAEEAAYLGLAKLEKPAAATATLRRLVKRNPESVDGRYRLAQRLGTARDLRGAIKQLRVVLERDPDHIDGRLDLSRALRMVGELPEAIAQMRGAFDRSGQALDIADELFWLLCESDDRVAAIDLLTLLDDDRSDTDALAAIARLERGLGRLDEAREIATRLGRLDADLGTLVHAEIDLAAGDPAGAAKRALTIGEHSKRAHDARRIAAAAWLAAAEPQRALDALAPARAAKPTDVDLASLLAFALVDLGKAAEARTLVATLPTGFTASFAQARVADHAGDAPAALAIVEGLIRDRPDTAIALNLAGYILADRNERLVDAERYLRRARELAPGDPAILDSWGWLLYRQGKSREAVRALDRAVRFAPREPEILVHLAAAWLADGAPQTAAATLERAAALRPSRKVQRQIDVLRAALSARG